MESRIYGVPLSAAQMGPSNNNISGIRAPLTVDESDSNVSSDYSGSESEGFESGEDMLETARVVNEVQEIVNEAGFVKRLSISEGAVVGLNGETIEDNSSNERGFVQESSNVGGNAVSRPVARIPRVRIYKRGGSSDDFDDSGSFLNEAEDEDYVANYSNPRPVVAVAGDEVLEVDDEVSEEELTPFMSIRVPPARKSSIPIAKISGESDDDSGGSDVVLDDEGFSGIVRAPSIEVLQRIDSTPKVRMLEADERDEGKSQAEDVVEMELDGNLLASGMVFSPLDESGPIAVEKSIVQDNGPDFDQETVAKLLAMNDVSDPTSESGHLIHLDEVIKEVDIVDDFKEDLELVDHREPADVEGIVVSNISNVASAAEFEFLYDKLTVPEVGKLGSHNNYFGAASLGNVDFTSSNNDLEDNRVFNQNNESEFVEGIKQEIDHTIESFSSEAYNPAHQCVDVKEVPAEGCHEFPELPEAVTNAMPTSISDGLFEYASQYVFTGSNLEQETGEGEETSGLSPGVMEPSRFHSDNKAAIAEKDMVQDSTTTRSGGFSVVNSLHIDGQVEGFDENVDIDGGMSGRSPAALPKGVRSDVSDDDVKFVSARLSNVARSSSGDDPSSNNGEQKQVLSEMEKEKIRKLQKIRLMYLRLLDRLGYSSEDYVASKVLYQLMLTGGSSYSQAFHLDSTKIVSMELESHEKDDLHLPLSILIIGKTGVGKSATINSIFDESAAVVDAFEPATTRVKEFVGLINGVKLKVFDTPGFRPSMDQSINHKILSSIKKLMKKSPPDVILYVDRIDTQRGDVNDLPLLRLITSCLGSSIWRKSIVAFTHGTSLPPDGPSGYPLSYEAFVDQQSQIIQRHISRSSGEPVVRNSGSVVPVFVIENHPSAEKNGHRKKLLHNGESWGSELLLLCCSMKILSELSSLIKNQSPLHYGRLFGPRRSSRRSEGNVCNETCMDGVSEQETEAAESEAVPPAEMTQSLSFSGDNCVSKPSPRLLRRWVLNYQCWDHNCNNNDLLIQDEVDFASVQLIEDKKELIIPLHSSVPAKHGVEESKLAYTLKIKNFRKNQTAAGVCINFVWENMVSDRIANGKQRVLVGNAGIIQSQDDAAFGVAFDLCRREKHHPINEDETSVGMSIMRCRDGLIYGCNLHSQISISSSSKLNITTALNNRRRGQISIKTCSCDQLQIAALALILIAGSIVKKFFGQSTE